MKKSKYTPSKYSCFSDVIGLYGGRCRLTNEVEEVSHQTYDDLKECELKCQHQSVPKSIMQNMLSFLDIDILRKSLHNKAINEYAMKRDQVLNRYKEIINDDVRSLDEKTCDIITAGYGRQFSQEIINLLGLADLSRSIPIIKCMIKTWDFGDVSKLKIFKILLNGATRVYPLENPREKFFTRMSHLNSSSSSSSSGYNDKVGREEALKLLNKLLTSGYFNVPAVKEYIIKSLIQNPKLETINFYLSLDYFKDDVLQALQRMVNLDTNADPILTSILLDEYKITPQTIMLMFVDMILKNDFKNILSLASRIDEKMRLEIINMPQPNFDEKYASVRTYPNNGNAISQLRNLESYLNNNDINQDLKKSIRVLITKLRQQIWSLTKR